MNKCKAALADLLIYLCFFFIDDVCSALQSQHHFLSSKEESKNRIWAIFISPVTEYHYIFWPEIAPIPSRTYKVPFMAVSVSLYRLLLYSMHLNHAAESLQHACASSRTCLPDSSFVSLTPTNGCMCFGFLHLVGSRSVSFLLLFCYADLSLFFSSGFRCLVPLEVCPGFRTLVLVWPGFLGEIEINWILERGGWYIKHCVNEVKTIQSSKTWLWALLTVIWAFLYGKVVGLCLLKSGTYCFLRL